MPVNTIAFYHWSTCNTCKTAKAALSQAGHELAERDFFRDRLTRAELVELLNGNPPSALFNPRSQTLKKAGIDPASLSEDQMLDLLVEEPRYWRRPVAIIDGKLIAGATAKVLAAELGG